MGPIGPVGHISPTPELNPLPWQCETGFISLRGFEDTFSISSESVLSGYGLGTADNSFTTPVVASSQGTQEGKINGMRSKRENLIL